MSDIHIIRASDVIEEVWERAEQRQAAHEAWQASPERWAFDGRPTWADLIAREPRLVAVEAAARRAGAGTEDYRRWYREIKPRIEALVGFLADGQPPPLCTATAYDVAYQHILRAYEGPA